MIAATKRMWSLALGAALVGGVSCSSSNRCVPGVQQVCSCAGGGSGIQTCAASGSFEACRGCGSATTDLAVTDQSDGMSATVASCPPVLFVLDRSGSMDHNANGNTDMPFSPPTRWDATKSALALVANSYDKGMPLGLITYQSDFAACEDFSAEITILPGFSQGPAFSTQLNLVQPSAGTNTGQAVSRAASILATYGASQPSRPAGYIVLLTDGDPNCGDMTDMGLPQTEPEYTVNRIAAAVTSGYRVIVVAMGITAPASQTVLNSMASAGAMTCAAPAVCGGQQYYPADSTTELEVKLGLILQRIVAATTGGSCNG